MENEENVETKTENKVNVENSLFGRRVILSSYNEVNKDNIVTILNEALPIHSQNVFEITYLENYKRGRQPVLQRSKSVRSEINNKVVCNRALEIVNFTTGYLLGEPVQYVSKGDKTNNITTLNDHASNVDKEYLDRELKENSATCGTSYRLVIPTNRGEETPFAIHTLDPESTFVIYNSGLGHKPLMGVMVIFDRDKNTNKEIVKYCCYTNNNYYEIIDGQIAKSEKHYLGEIPIIEYPNNKSRLGDFEPVIPLLNAINLIYSNRLDGVEQFIQSLMKFINVDISLEDYENLKKLGAIKVKKDPDSEGTVQDVEYMTQELNQTQVQTLIDSLYQDILTIVGMPNRNGGSSTSDTGAAVIMRDGWEAAEARAKSSELIFKRSEKKALRIMLLCMKKLHNVDLHISDIAIKFTRRNYENINQKATVLTTMLGSNKIHPKLAFEHCGLFSDPEVAYIISKNYSETLTKIQNTLTDNKDDKENTDNSNGQNQEPTDKKDVEK